MKLTEPFEIFFKASTGHAQVPPGGLIGIEVEVEPDGLLNLTEGPTKWAIKQDHSLRNGGLEFTTTGGIEPLKVPEALADLQNLLRKTKLKPSLRTSVHLHIGVKHLSALQILTVGLLWWLIEDAVLRTQPEERSGNLHCLRLSDAEYLMQQAVNEILSSRESTPLSIIGHPENRYLALNFASLWRFATLEFRFLALPKDLSLILPWSLGLHQFVFAAAAKTLDEVRDYIRRPSLEVLFGLLPRGLALEVQGVCGSRLTDLLMTNQDKLLVLVSKLASVLRSSETFDEDYDGEQEAKDRAKRFSSSQAALYLEAATAGTTITGVWPDELYEPEDPGFAQDYESEDDYTEPEAGEF